VANGNGHRRHVPRETALPRCRIFRDFPDRHAPIPGCVRRIPLAWGDCRRAAHGRLHAIEAHHTAVRLAVHTRSQDTTPARASLRIALFRSGGLPGPGSCAGRTLMVSGGEDPCSPGRGKSLADSKAEGARPDRQSERCSESRTIMC
jgi:hypothetical protein